MGVESRDDRIFVCSIHLRRVFRSYRQTRPFERDKLYLIGHLCRDEHRRPTNQQSYGLHNCNVRPNIVSQYGHGGFAGSVIGDIQQI